MTNLVKRYGLIGIAIVFLAAAIVGWTQLRNPHEERGHIEVFGNVDVRQVNLGFKVPGRLAEMMVDEGDKVAAGAVVAKLEPVDYENEVKLAQARVARSQAALNVLLAGSRPQEIAQAEAQLAEAEAALTVAETTLSRQEFLAERDIASHQAHEEAEARHGAAIAQRDAAAKSLELARIGPRSEDIDQARSVLAAEQAARALAEQRVADTMLTAPNEGIILTRVREPGAIIGAGETIYTLTLTSPVWVRAYIEEPDLDLIQAGMDAEVRTDSGRVYTGQIGFISPVAEFTPKTVETRSLRTSLVYRVRIIVEDPEHRLKQGMPVTVMLSPDRDV